MTAYGSDLAYRYGGKKIFIVNEEQQTSITHQSRNKAVKIGKN